MNPTVLTSMRSMQMRIFFSSGFYSVRSYLRCTARSTKTVSGHCPFLCAAGSLLRTWNTSSSIIDARKMYTPALALSRRRLRHTFAFAAAPKPRVSASADDWLTLLGMAPALLLVHLWSCRVHTPRVFRNLEANDCGRISENNCHRSILTHRPNNR